MKDFEGKCAFVTGASRGIGKAIALELAQGGANVAFNYLWNDKAAVESQREIEDMGVKCLRIRANLSDADKIRGMFSRIEQEFERLDILVNNAASGVQRPANELKEKHWDWTMNINAKAPWLCSIEASKLMVCGGSIVNITSQGSTKVLPYYFSVGTSKAALEAVTRYLAVELASQGITVNAVSGGYVDTEALESFPNREEMLKHGQETLAHRLVEPKDIARVVAFLCSGAAEMIRGQVIIVDGGMSLKV